METGIPQKINKMDPGQNDIFKDTITSAAIGGAGAAARAALSKNKIDWVTWGKHVFAGAVMAVFVGFATKGVISSETMRYAVIGVSSVIAPELFQSIIEMAPAIAKKLFGKIIGRP